MQNDALYGRHHNHRLSIMNIHGPRCIGRRKRKACMGWSWAAAYRGGSILRGFLHSLCRQLQTPTSSFIVIVVVTDPTNTTHYQGAPWLWKVMEFRKDYCPGLESHGK